MKTIVALFLACFASSLFGQAPPILRNWFSTNSDTAVHDIYGVTNYFVPLPTFYLDSRKATNAVGTAPQVWPDVTRHGYDATNATAGARPTLNANRLNGWPAFTFDGSDDAFYIKGFDANTMTSNCTVYILMRPVGSTVAGAVGLAIQGSGGIAYNNSVFFDVDYTDARWYCTASSGAHFNANINSNAWVLAGFTFDGASQTFRSRMNGAGNIEQIGYASSMLSTGKMVLGAEWTGGSTLYNAPVEIAAVLLWTNTSLSVQQCVAVEDKIFNDFGMSGEQIIFDGDSNMYGLGIGLASGSNAPALAIAMMGSTNAWQLAANIGFSGLNAATWAANAPTNLFPSIRKGTKYAVMPPAKNSIRAGVGATVILSNINYVVNGVANRGGIVYLGDILPDNGGGFGPLAYDTNRLAVMAGLDFLTNRPNVIRVHFNPLILASNAIFTSYYDTTDGVNADHLTNNGCAVMAQDFVNVIRGRLIPDTTISSNLTVLGTITAPSLGSNNAPVAFIGVDSSGNIKNTYVPSISGAASTNNAGFGQVDPTQFATNNNTLVAKNGSVYTNIGVRGITLPDITPSRVVMVNGSGVETNVTSAGAATTEFVLANGTITKPNIYEITNSTGTAVTADWNGPARLRLNLSGTTTISFTNCPAAGSLWKDFILELYATTTVPATTIANVDSRAINFGRRGLQLVSGETNIVRIFFDGTNFIGSCEQDLITGSGPYALQSNAVLYAVTHLSGEAFTNQTLSGTGGANTNFAGNYLDAIVYVNGGTSNVDLTIMPGPAGLSYFPTYVISNLTTSTRIITGSPVTNSWEASLQQYTGVAFPLTLSNKHTGWLSTKITSTNVEWSFLQRTNKF